MSLSIITDIDLSSYVVRSRDTEADKEPNPWSAPSALTIERDGDGRPLYPNLDTKQYLDPHAFGAGRNLPAIALRQQGVMMALTILLAVSNGRGGGDFHGEDPLVGAWGCQRIVIGSKPADGEDLSGQMKSLIQTVEGRWIDDETWTLGSIPKWMLTDDQIRAELAVIAEETR